MKMQKTKSDYIKDELARDFDQPAARIVNRLKNRGVNIREQLVWNVKSVMNKNGRIPVGVKKALETRFANTKMLREHILTALAGGKKLTISQIGIACRKQGYVSDPDHWESHLNKKIRMMELDNQVIRRPGGKWMLIFPPPQRSLMPTATTAANQKQQPAVAVPQEEAAVQEVVPQQEVAAPQQEENTSVTVAVLPPVKKAVPFVEEEDSNKPAAAVQTPTAKVDEMARLLEVHTLCRKYGSVEEVQRYLNIISSLQT